MRALRRAVTTATGTVLLIASISMALPAIAEITTFSGSVDANGTVGRAHAFSVPSTGEIDATLDWNTSTTNLNLFLINPSGTRVAMATSKTARPESITYQATVTGTWKLRVKAVSGAASYTLTVDRPSDPGSGGPATYERTLGGGMAGHADMYPSGIDVDSAGNLYVADTGDDQVQAYDSAGQLLWEVGSRGAKAPGRFTNPRDVAHHNGKVYVADTGYKRVQVLNASNGASLDVWSAAFGTIMGISAGVDGSGNPVILIAESTSGRVRIFTPAGAQIRTVGSPGTGDGQLGEPRDAATSPNGTIFVADYKNNRIAKFTPTGGWAGSFGGKGTNPGQFIRPYGVDFDEAGALYVSDNNERISKLTTSGTFLKSWGSEGGGAGQFFILRRVAVGSGSSPDVWGADLWGLKVERFAQGGAHERTYGGTPAADGFFNEAYGLSVDGSHLFVADTTNQRVQRFSSSSPYGFQLTWGARGWGEGNPGLNWARDIAISPADGTVWVADTKNHRLLEFSRTGTPGRKMGSGGSGANQMNRPYGLVGVGDDLIVADTVNNRIQRWDTDAATVTWTATMAGGLALKKPKDVAVHDGIVYVADSENRRIVLLSAATGSVQDVITNAAFHRIEGIAVEPDGDLWIADTSFHRVLQVSGNGSTVLQTVGGGAGSAHGKFNKPAHLEILTDAAGMHLFVADEWNDRIEVFDIG